MCATFRESGQREERIQMSDKERGKLMKATDDRGGDEVEAHKHGGREADKHGGREDNIGTDDDSDTVEAHKLGHKDS
jgi:hypothetical protein